MPRISLARIAKKDLVTINDNLRRQAGATVAGKYRRSFGEMFQRLSEHPESSQYRPEYGQDVRTAVVWPYVVLYRYEPSRHRVLILRILHGYRRIALDAP